MVSISINTVFMNSMLNKNSGQPWHAPDPHDMVASIRAQLAPLSLQPMRRYGGPTAVPPQSHPIPLAGPSHPPIPPIPVQPLHSVPPQSIASIHAQMAALPLRPVRRHMGPATVPPQLLANPAAGPAHPLIHPPPAHSSHDMVASIYAQMATLPLQPVRRHMGPPTIPPIPTAAPPQPPIPP